MTTGSRDLESKVAPWGYQFRFLLGLCLIFAFGGFLLFLAMFLIFSRPLVGDYSSVYFALRHLGAFVLPVIAFSALAYVLLVCGATAVLCILALHKVAGPIYKMERVLESYVSGDPVKPVFFRHGDQIVPVAAAFNGFVGCLREDRQRCLAVMEHAERLCLQDQATCRAEMETALSELEALLSKYR